MKEIKGYMLPENYDEMSMALLRRLHAVSMKENSDDHDVYAAFLGVSREELMALDISDIDIEVNKHLSKWYFNQVDWDKFPMPETIEIMGKTIKIPKDLALETYGQKVLAERAIMEDGGKDVVGLSSKVVAIYLHNKVFDVKLDDEKITELEAVIDTMPAKQIYPIASFFFTQLDAILKNESDKLRTEQDADSIKAGISNLEQFGVMNTVVDFAERFGYKFDEVLELQYSIVFLVQHRDKVLGEFKDKLFKIHEHRR